LGRPLNRRLLKRVARSSEGGGPVTPQEAVELVGFCFVDLREELPVPAAAAGASAADAPERDVAAALATAASGLASGLQQGVLEREAVLSAVSSLSATFNQVMRRDVNRGVQCRGSCEVHPRCLGSFEALLGFVGIGRVCRLWAACRLGFSM
jgi:hypothetical protein